MTTPSLNELLGKESFTLEEFVGALVGTAPSGSFRGTGINPTPGTSLDGVGIFAPAPPTPKPQERPTVSGSVGPSPTSGSALPVAAVSQSRSLLFGLLFN